MWGAEAVFYLQAEGFFCASGRGLIAATAFRRLISAVWFLFQKVRLTEINKTQPQTLHSSPGNSVFSPLFTAFLQKLI